VRAHIEPQLEENRLAQSVLMSFFLKKESKSNVAGNKRQNKKEVKFKGKKRVTPFCWLFCGRWHVNPKSRRQEDDAVLSAVLWKVAREPKSRRQDRRVREWSNEDYRGKPLAKKKSKPNDPNVQSIVDQGCPWNQTTPAVCFINARRGSFTK